MIDTKKQRLFSLESLRPLFSRERRIRQSLSIKTSGQEYEMNLLIVVTYLIGREGRTI